MSRIGRNPIAVPANVTLSVGDDVVTVKGPNGTMTRQIPDGITLVAEGDTWIVDRRNDETSTRRCTD